MTKEITRTNRLKVERNAMTKTQKEMASIFDITERQYRALERGESHGSVSFWFKAKEYYQKPIGYLLGWDDVV